MKTEGEAATKIQALARGAVTRMKVKDDTLWRVWNELDWKEESELMSTHGQFEELRKRVEARRKGGKADVPAATPAASAPAAEEYTIPAADVKKPPAKKPEEKKEEKKMERKESLKAAQDDGLTLTWPITIDFVTSMMDHFKSNKVLDEENVVALLTKIKPLLAALPNVVEVPVNTRITVVGDLHGQLDDLFHIFKLCGLPSDRNVYLFNGDFVDRGQHSCEVVLTLFAWKLLYPDFLLLNRGNHEARDINSRDGFEKECVQKYSLKVFDLFSEVFAALPLAHVLGSKVYVVHGGLTAENETIASLNKVDRFFEVPPTDTVMEQMMWSDPDHEEGRQASPRGAALLFGPDITEQFLSDNNLSLIIRSHECQQKGYDRMHDDRLITVFSASNYCGTVGNDGAFVFFEKDMQPHIVQYYAKPKERLSRYRMRHAVMENDIIAKLLQRIADNRLGLVNHYRTIDTEGLPPCVITRAQWAEGLKKVLKLNIPFLEFQDYLGLPKLGVDGTKKGPIDYMAFLLRFKPVNTMVGGGWRVTEGNNGSSREAVKSLEALNDMLYTKRYELESLFRHFDLNGDESISLREFKEGILSVQSLLTEDNRFTEKEVDELVTFLDVNKDGEISYSEFFSSFQLVDPKLAASGPLAKARRPHGAAPASPMDVSRDNSPSPRAVPQPSPAAAASSS